MDVRVGEYMEERPLGHSIVKISELCKWSEAEGLYYDFQQIIGDNYQFVQAELLFPLVSYWSTQHITPQAAQGVMAKKGSTMAGHLIADDPSISMWAVGAAAHNAFERLFYEAVITKKLRLVDGLTRIPLVDLPTESHARIVELGCVAHSAHGKIEAETDGKRSNQRPLPQQQFQEQEILRVIRELFHDPKKLPKPISGKPGIKARVRQALTFQPKVFDKAWDRLRANQDIQDAE